MLSLGLTSSTALVGLALARDSQVVCERAVTTDRRHAEEITPMLATVMTQAGVALTDLDRIVVDVGPGRYTGMRVGIATAKALAFALSVPVVAVTSLELIGAAAPAVVGPAFAVIDARRDQVFAQRVDPGADGDRMLVVSPAGLIEQLPIDATLVGDGADRYAELFAAAGLSVVPGIGPGAGKAAVLDPSRRGGPAAAVEPVYLREPDAAINIKTRHGVVRR